MPTSITVRLPIVIFATLLAGAPAATLAAPSVLAPGVISGSSDDADPAFTPDGDTVFFARNDTIMVSHRVNDAWSAPEIAAFSGAWLDHQPTMAPDGSFLVFASNRPVPGRAAVASNLWRVDRGRDTWDVVTRLPDEVNRGASIWAPSIAGDGSVYFIQKARPDGPFRLWRAQARGRGFAPAIAISFGDPTTQDVDPAVAPDESFIVFGTMHPGPDAHERLAIAFREDAGWGKPLDLGAEVNGDGTTDTNEARLGPDHRTLYFASSRTTAIHLPRTREQARIDLDRIARWDNGLSNIWSASLAHRLDARARR